MADVSNSFDASAMAGVEWLSTGEHVRRRPDMYIGSIVPVETKGLTFRLIKPMADVPAKAKLTVADVERVAFACTEISPAFLKLLDEMVVNALDNGLRDARQKNVRIGIDARSGTLEVYNDGAGLGTQKFGDTGRHSISIIFGEYMSGTNLGMDQETFAGGRNGYGISLVNTFSTRFTVETACPSTKTLYRQEWTDNMKIEHPPTIKAFRAATGFVRVTCDPDWVALGMAIPGENGLSPDIVLALSRRAWDAAACSALHPMRVSWSEGSGWSLPLPVRSGVDMLKVIVGESDCKGRTMMHDTVCLEDGTIVLDVAACIVSADEASLLDSSRWLGYVNGIRCCSGSHMRHVTDRIVELVRERVRTRSKRDEVTLRPQQILQHLGLCITCLVADKQFESQAKECLTTAAKNLGFTWKPSDKFKTALLDRTDIVETMLQTLSTRDTAAAHKASSRTGVSRIAKYDPPAAGRTKGRRPQLLVAEGDSAKEFLVGGVSAIGRENFGLYALKGKPLNTRNHPDKMDANKEINELSRILGLRHGVEYTAESVAALPFEHLVIVADQDVDGAHIGGLIMNWIESSHPSLLRVKPDFVQRFMTALIRATSPAGETALFYSSAEFVDWASTRGGEVEMRCSGWQFKYYKGLGTSTSAEARQYFTNYNDHILSLVHTGDTCREAMSGFFDGKRADDRKAMLDNYDHRHQLDYRAGTATYEKIVSTELAHFAFYDTQRSIPGFDGLKPVQRKALSYFLDKHIVEQVKVAQAGASAASYSSYHHGEKSIIDAIVGMAQEFVGTNNVPLMLPIGQFGSRNNKPSVHAAPRYIFTSLNEPVITKLFRKEDDAVLQRVFDEGKRAEPELYVGVVPLALLNPTTGIGTGFSTYLPPYDPVLVIAACRQLAQCEQPTIEGTLHAVLDPAVAPLSPLVPHYAGFTGPQEMVQGNLLTDGIWCVDGDRLTITELPVGTWVEPYLDFVRTKLMTPAKGVVPLVLDLFNGSSETGVHIELACDLEQLGEIDIVKTFHLRATRSLSNMWIFGPDKRLQKLTDPRDLLRDHAVLRVQTYERRRLYQIEEQLRASGRAGDVLRFVRMVIRGEIELRARPMAELEAELANHGFLPGQGPHDYSHLLKLPLSSITAERATRLQEDQERLDAEVIRLQGLTPCRMWLTELDELESAVAVYQLAKQERNSGGGATTKKPKGVRKRKRKPSVTLE